jgi:hypothetical protein
MSVIQPIGTLKTFPKEKKRRIFNNQYYKLYQSSLGISMNFTNYGIMLDSLPNEVMESLENIVTKINKNIGDQVSLKDNLAGEIGKEFQCKFDNVFLDYLDDLLKYYEVKSGGFIKSIFNGIADTRLYYLMDKIKTEYLDKNIQTNLTNIDYCPKMVLGNQNEWVNFQEKYEFNPPHSHSGVLSFVIWYDIPFYMEDELLKSPSQKTEFDKRENGYFNFIPRLGEPTMHTSMSVPIAADKRLNGTICLFPSSLSHSVYPFYSSDDYRITFSGNLRFENFSKSFDDYIEQIKKHNNFK